MRGRRVWLIAAAVVVVLVAVAWAVRTYVLPDQALAGRWQLVSGTRDGRPVPVEESLTLDYGRFGDFHSYGGNTYQGTYDTSGGEVTVTIHTGTAVGSTGTSPAQDAILAVARGDGGPSHYVVRGDTLTLTRDDWTLVFQRG